MIFFNESAVALGVENYKRSDVLANFGNFEPRVWSISGVVTKSYNGDDRVLALNNIDDINFDGARCDPLFSDNFSSNNLDNWTQFSVEGEQVWDITPYGNPAPSARISG